MSTTDTNQPQLIVRPKAEIVKLSKTQLERLSKLMIKHHESAVGFNVMATKFAILCGFVLLKVKGSLDRGMFEPWIEEKVATVAGFGLRTAQRYMAKARRFTQFVRKLGIQCDIESEMSKHLNSQLLIDFQSHTRKTGIVTIQSSATANPTKQNVDPNIYRSPPSVIDAVISVLGEIICDPCALPMSWDTDFAQINYTPEQDGLSELPWMQTAWVCPGHNIDCNLWYDKACFEIENKNLREAILCLPESTIALPGDLLRRPVAITPEPLTVVYCESGEAIERVLPTRSLFVYLSSEEPDLDKFARAFRDIAVVFAPVATH